MNVVSQNLARTLLLAVLAGAIASVIGGRTEAQQAATPGVAAQAPVTFNHDIAPIVYRVCAQCHRPGEAAPFSLLTYDDAKSHARQIAAVTKSRVMPPWLPAAGKLKFADELRLSESEIARIQAWV